MTAEKFAGRESILVLNILYSFKNVCDDCDVSDPPALRILRHYLVGSLQSDFLACISVAFDGSRRGIDSILSFPDNVYWLLLKYAADSVLCDAFRAFQKMRQCSNETEEMFARCVREQARLMVEVFDESCQSQPHLIDGVEPNVRCVIA